MRQFGALFPPDQVVPHLCEIAVENISQRTIRVIILLAIMEGKTRRVGSRDMCHLPVALALDVWRC